MMSGALTWPAPTITDQTLDLRSRLIAGLSLTKTLCLKCRNPSDSKSLHERILLWHPFSCSYRVEEAERLNLDHLAAFFLDNYEKLAKEFEKAFPKIEGVSLTRSVFESKFLNNGSDFAKISENILVWHNQNLLFKKVSQPDKQATKDFDAYVASYMQLQKILANEWLAPDVKGYVQVLADVTGAPQEVWIIMEYVRLAPGAQRGDLRGITNLTTDLRSLETDFRQFLRKAIPSLSAKGILFYDDKLENMLLRVTKVQRLQNETPVARRDFLLNDMDPYYCLEFMEMEADESPDTFQRTLVLCNALSLLANSLRQAGKNPLVVRIHEYVLDLLTTATAQEDFKRCAKWWFSSLLRLCQVQERIVAQSESRFCFGPCDVALHYMQDLEYEGKKLGLGAGFTHVGRLPNEAKHIGWLNEVKQCVFLRTIGGQIAVKPEFINQRDEGLRTAFKKVVLADVEQLLSFVVRAATVRPHQRIPLPLESLAAATTRFAYAGDNADSQNSRQSSQTIPRSLRSLAAVKNVRFTGHNSPDNAGSNNRVRTSGQNAGSMTDARVFSPTEFNLFRQRYIEEDIKHATKKG